MKRTTRALGLTLALLLAVASAGLLASCAGDEAHGGKYHCPMHPTYISDRPGDCPICGMRLVPIEEKTAPTTVPAYVCPMHPEVTSDRPGERCSKCGMKLVEAGAADRDGGGAAAAHATYTCPMHPEFRTDDPAARCPECGMKLVPAKEGDRGPGTGDGEKQDAHEPASGGVAGMAPVDLAPEAVRLAGVQTETAVRRRVGRQVRTVGNVVADERRVRHVHTKIAGWVEHLHVNFTGQLVRAGEPILSLYSQELLASQEEFLRARETAARYAASALPEVRRGGDDLLAAARRRLALFDVPESFIAELERTGEPRRAVTLAAPATGFVTAKEIFEGQQVEPGMELFVIADLSRVWVEAEFYEFEAGSLALGQTARVTLPYDPSRALAGRVQYVNPTLDAATRTLRVRFEFDNRDYALKPGMFANVEIELDGADGVAIPDSAVLDTGERQVVFVARGGGRFEPRLVTVGARSGGVAQVLAGVAEGEAVVVRANFLLDSESRLRAAIAGATAVSGTGDRKPGAAEAGHAH